MNSLKSTSTSLLPSLNQALIRRDSEDRQAGVSIREQPEDIRGWINRGKRSGLMK